MEAGETDPTQSMFPIKYEVDYVRVYQEKYYHGKDAHPGPNVDDDKY